MIAENRAKFRVERLRFLDDDKYRRRCTARLLSAGKCQFLMAALEASAFQESRIIT